MLSVEYIAGFIDGEGTITINTNLRSRGIPRVSIVNTNYDVLRLISYTINMWGVSNSIYTDCPKVSSRHKIVHRLQVYDKQAVLTLCEVLLPHLVIKGEHAKIVIDFIKRRRMEGRQGTTFKELEKAMITRIRGLNRRGA